MQFSTKGCQMEAIATLYHFCKTLFSAVYNIALIATFLPQYVTSLYFDEREDTSFAIYMEI